ncbi:MAG: TRAP transporter fused permease subunit [Rhizobiales bacterium]|nr:TRAP transporter fused permease subunit [Hyphomicrobiales bacterium]
MARDVSKHGPGLRSFGSAALPYPNGLIEMLAVLLTLGGVGWALDVYNRIGLRIYDQQYLAAILAIALAMAFLKFPIIGKEKTELPWYDAVAAVVAFAAVGYLAYDYPTIADLIYLRSADSVTVCVILIVLLIEALRRATGPVLSILVVVFIVYALFADYLPGSGIPTDWRKLSLSLAANTTGILGLPIKVAATIVIAFVLFGQILSQTGGMRFFTDIAMAAMGGFRGGAAKIAVLGSFLFGSISGSAVANVVATGIVTIPLMKRAGVPAHKAGAIEAVASTGGQLMPPVMGAAAFLMAEFLEISYAEVVIAALVPGILYYVALFIQADLDAAKQGIPPVDLDKIPRAGKVLRAGWYFPIAFVILLVGLFYLNLQPEKAVMWSIVGLLVAAVAFGFEGKRPGPGDLLTAFRETGHGALDLILITAAAGIVIGVLAISGLGYQLTLILVQVGQGNLLLLLLLSGAVCIILGMGLPTVGVYVLLAALVAPSLIEVGVQPIAAHMYVMYFGMMSMITPPIAIAAFAAASVAEADPMKTGFAAVRFGWTAFIVPILFVFSPSLLLIGEPAAVVIALITALLGVWLVSIATIGHFQRPLGAPMRVLFAAAGFAALTPADLFPGGALVDMAGVVGGVILIGYEYMLARRRRAALLVKPAE